MSDPIIPKKRLKILLLEDVPTDAELELRELARAGILFESRVVSDREAFQEGLSDFHPDIILSDYSFPSGFNGLVALSIAREVTPDTPFIFVSGTIGEERAIESLKMGATDYILKNRPDRLPQAVLRAIEEVEEKIALRTAEEALRKSEERFSLFMKHLPGVSYIRDPDGTYLYINSYWAESFGLEISDVIGAKGTDIWPLDIAEAMRKNDLKVLDTRKSLQTVEITRMHGQTRYWLSTKFPILGKNDTIDMVAGMSVDITERQQQEFRIKRLNRIHEVLSGINSAIVRIRDRDALFQEVCRIAVNQGGFPSAWIALLDKDSERGIPAVWKTRNKEESQPDPVFHRLAEDVTLGGKSLRDRQVVIVNDIFNEMAGGGRESLLERGDRSIAFFPIRIRDGETGALAFHMDEVGAFNGSEVKLLMELSDDLSFALESIEKEERLNYLAYFDVLTGLPNRTLFLDRLNQFLEASKESFQSMAILTIALERFQALTDTMGRRTGDLLLKEFSSRLIGIAEMPSSVAHIKDDSFAMILNGIESEAEVFHFLEDRLYKALEEPFLIFDQEIRILVRVGVALFPGDGHDAETLMKNAGTALLRAQGTGESILFYTQEMNARVAEKLKLETKIHKAIKNREFILYYQPKVDLRTGLLKGLEALIRWQDPDNGLVPPFQFIPILEETGLILDVGGWVIDQAISHGLRWIHQGLLVPRVAVNVSAVQLRQRNFSETVEKVLDDSGSNSFPLEIEITESLIMEDITGTIPKLQRLKEKGVSISIDDFGTGYSSLNYLAKLPANELKIDQSFIVNVEESRDSRSIVSAIISLAHSLGLSVVAEGVETDGQIKLLRNLGCDAVQGYLISRPVPSGEVDRFLIPGASFL